MAPAAQKKERVMRSMTGYGRAEADHRGTKFSVELNSVNRKQSDIVINLPRDLAELEPRIRQTINESISRGRTNANITFHSGGNGARNLALDTELARSYHEAMRALQKELNAPGEITISTILQAPGVMRFPEQVFDAEEAWPAIDRALRFNQNARTRGQTSRQGFDPSPESDPEKAEGGPRISSRCGQKIPRRSRRSHPEGWSPDCQ